MGSPSNDARRPGEDSRRWLRVNSRNTALDTPSTPNPADMEANIREALGMPSSMRAGIILALHQAMSEEGVDPEGFATEPVMLAGHSQGGLIAVNLGSLSAQEIGIDVRAILAMGAPARRTRIRP